MKSTFSLTALAAAAALAFSAHAQQPAGGSKTLKMQSTWPASLTLQDNFRYFAERVDKLTSGAVKIEAMAAGQIVPAFEILDATHKKVLDGGHEQGDAHGGLPHAGEAGPFLQRAQEHHGADRGEPRRRQQQDDQDRQRREQQGGDDALEQHAYPLSEATWSPVRP